MGSRDETGREFAIGGAKPHATLASDCMKKNALAKNAVQLTLVISDLVWPRDAFAPGTPKLPGLARLLSACVAWHEWEHGLEGLLCQRFGIARERDWPLGPLLAQSDGATPGGDYWLCADPVYLQADRDT